MTHELETALADDRYDEAKRLVLASQNAGASHLQRKMNIGWNRASRFLEAMESEGLVSRFDARGHRDVLADAQNATDSAQGTGLAVPEQDATHHGSANE